MAGVEAVGVRDVAGLVVTRAGRVEATGDPTAPYRLVDGSSGEVAAVGEFLHDMLADDASPASLRSYSHALLGWFRFLWAVDVAWDASRIEARDFALWLRTASKPPRLRRGDAPAPGSINQVTGKSYPGEQYAATRSQPADSLKLRDRFL